MNATDATYSTADYRFMTTSGIPAIFHNPYHNFGARMGAQFLDLFLVLLAIAWTSRGLGIDSPGAEAWLLLPLYRALMHGLVGATVGKFAVGVRVVRASDLQPAGLPRAFVREIPLFIASALWLSNPGLAFLSAVLLKFVIILSAASGEYGRSVQDVIAGTVVIQRRWLDRFREEVARPVAIVHAHAPEQVLAVQLALPILPASMARTDTAPRTYVPVDRVSLADAPLASPVQRIQATLIDATIVFALLSVMSRAVDGIEGGRFFLAAAGLWGVVAAYTVACTARSGVTPGKQVLGLRVVMADTRHPASWQTAFLRAGPCLLAGLLPALLLLAVTDADAFLALPASGAPRLSLADPLPVSVRLALATFVVIQLAWPFIYGTGIFTGPDRQSLGDRFAGTLVVHQHEVPSSRPIPG